MAASVFSVMPPSYTDVRRHNGIRDNDGLFNMVELSYGVIHTYMVSHPSNV